MNEINFLPRSYWMAHARRRRAQRRSFVAAGLAMCLIGWHFWVDARLDHLHEYAVVLGDAADAVRSQMNEVERLRVEHAGLSRQLRVYRQIVQPVTPCQVMAALGEMMPESLSLTTLSVLGERLEVSKKKPRHRGQSRSTGVGGAATGAPDEAQEKSRIRVVMTGLAPSDLVVADFVGRLSGYPLFNDVKMRSSRTVNVDGLLAREFRIEAEVPLDREYLPTASSDGEVARAD